MLTPQEVSSHAFPKAVMGGYNMSSVDEFLDELTEDYASLYKENAGLKAKLKVLVEKVEDYRATEDAMRSTLLTAQKMADSIVKEAEAKRDQMAVQAEVDARNRITQMQSEAAEALERLKAGQRELAVFIAASKDICAKELAFLDQLPQLPVTLPSQAPEAVEQKKKEDAAGEIEQNLYAAFQAEAAAAERAQAAPEKPAEDASADEDLLPEDEPTQRIDLNDLKFGRNYLGGDS